jgi:tetratricopeptide (TPR) repeat protein
MGSVYRAHDPHLSRDVALKVLHASYSGEQRRSDYTHRLLREAQALAKLSHPNVVAAFDVGTHDDVLFVAMELVEGESLRSWLRHKHDVSEVLRVLIAAGRGLVAAHTAGVLHRDFKPANVMVSPDGRVRVVDFGLARSVIPGTDASAAGEPDGALLEGEITASGSIMGTPGYIAPEQLQGAPASVFTDQYGFAVTAFVALAGQRPPAVTTPAVPSTREPLEWPRKIPRNVRSVVERGLAPQARDRHPSLAAMLDELERTIAPKRRRGTWLALALSVTLAAGGTLWSIARGNRVTCEVGSESFARVWDAEHRSALLAALSATGRANAEEAFALLAARLDAFRSSWLAMKRESCEATYVHAKQSEKVHALRNACLERKLEAAAALVTVFSRSDPAAVDRAAGATPDSLDECADEADLLGMAARLPAEPTARDSIARLESGFATTRALAIAGKWQEARASGEAQLAEARALGHGPTIARALRWAAFAIYSQARTAEERRQGEAYLREAIPLAALGGDDRLVASTASYLFELMAYGQRRIEEAEAMLPHVEALVARAGNRAEDRLEVGIGRARIMSERGRLTEAIALLEQVIALSDGMQQEWKAFGAAARAEMGSIYIELENFSAATHQMQAALASVENIFGRHHPRVLLALANQALAQSKVDGDAALASIARMRELASTLPAADWRMITVPMLEGQVREDRGDCAGALPFYRDGLVLFEKTYGRDASPTADVHARLGACFAATGQRAEALSALERALAIRRARGETPNSIAKAAFEVAKALGSRTARPAERVRAIALAEEARSLWQQAGLADRARAVDPWLSNQRDDSATANRLRVAKN